MRVRDKSGGLAPAGATPLGGAGSAAGAAAARSPAAVEPVEAARAARPPMDVATTRFSRILSMTAPCCSADFPGPTNSGHGIWGTPSGLTSRRR